MTNSPHDAAAFWGSAQNNFYSHTERLSLALHALEFFGKFYEEVEDSMENGPMLVFELHDEGHVSPYYNGNTWDAIEPGQLMSQNPELDYHLFYARVHLLPA